MKPVNYSAESQMNKGALHGQQTTEIRQILVVDDEMEITQQISDHLSSEDKKVHYILDPAYIFQTLELLPIDLILLDVYLPGTDGMSLLKQLKSNEDYSHIPVIMLTADLDEELLASCMDSGASDFINKPIQKVVLRARVDSALASRQYIKQLRDTLQEKEVLLKEIHHRVKNNLQIISSLFLLQSNQTQDLELQHTLQECRGRVSSMSLIHEKLYQSRNLAKIDMSVYTQELVREIFYSYDKEEQKIQLELSSDEIHLGVDLAVPSALIINELVSNALKYAFSDGSGILRVNITKSPNICTIEVSDNGRGISDEIDFFSANTLGLRLVRLLTSQLKGEVKLDNKLGTTFTISFPLMED